MPRNILIDEYHVSVLVPSDLAEADYAAIKATLDDHGFQQELLQAVREVVGRHPTLAKAKVKLSR
jgi:hypothetical protein